MLRLASLGQTVANAAQSWPFQDNEEEQYLRDGYSNGVAPHVALEHGAGVSMNGTIG